MKTMTESIEELEKEKAARLADPPAMTSTPSVPSKAVCASGATDGTECATPDTSATGSARASERQWAAPLSALKCLDAGSPARRLLPSQRRPFGPVRMRIAAAKEALKLMQERFHRTGRLIG
jgi:hypothetical protein